MLFSSSGLQLNLHYCGGKVVFVGFVAEHSHCDSAKDAECKMPKTKKIESDCCKVTEPIANNNCCTDQTINYLSTDDFQPETKPLVSIKWLSLLCGFYAPFNAEITENIIFKVLEYPPQVKIKQHHIFKFSQLILFG